MSKTILQYASAVNSSNLADDETHHTLDVLAAVALTSALGSLLYRVKYANDEISLKPLMLIWREMVEVRARRGKWLHVADQVADISMWHWVDEICQECKGRGHPVVINTPTLEAATCQCCQGTGRKKLACDAEILEMVRDCVETLNRMANEAGRKAHNKLL